MIKYAKIIDKDTKECSVGLGTNEAFYIKIGMYKQDVEQCSWNGRWYLTGHVPTEPEELVKQKRIAQIKAELASKDEKSTRSVRAILAGTATEDDRQFLTNVEIEVQALRQELRELEG